MSNLTYEYLCQRGPMTRWCYAVADAINFQKETVEIAISMADRYVVAPGTVLDVSNLQGVFVTCLYTSAKIHEEKCISSKQMETLTRGLYTSKDIEEMEKQILSTIHWRVNPPTAISFARSLVDLIPVKIIPGIRTLMEIVELQVKLLMSEEKFSRAQASTIGCAALMNVLQYTIEHSKCSSCYKLFAQQLNFDEMTGKSRLKKIQKKMALHVWLEAAGNERDPDKSSKPTTSHTTSSPTCRVMRKLLLFAS